MNLSLDYLNRLEELEIDIEYFNNKISAYRPVHWTDPNHLNVRRVILNHRKMKEIFEIYKITAKRTDIGIRMFLMPHNF
jgi:hypothetical protein